MTETLDAVYGSFPEGLTDVAPRALQCSPRVPGSTPLAEFAPSSLASIVVYAPPSVLERRRVLALALRTLVPGGVLTALAPNTRGGARLADELGGFGCTVAARPKRHHQIVTTARPATGRAVGAPALDDAALDEAIAAGAPRLLGDLGLWSEPGQFSWDHVDPGSALLIDHLPRLDGAGCDLGCGVGALARAVRINGGTGPLVLVDTDQRALTLAQRNVPGEHVTTLWADVRSARGLPTGVDFVVSNPPFHDGGAEDRALGQAFLRAAAGMLRPGGVLWLTANRHLPYEAPLAQAFASVERVADARGYKIFCARVATKSAQPPKPQARPKAKPRR